MGEEGTETRVREGIVLDAGALIAFERGNEAMAVIVAEAGALGANLLVPAAALAQTWRGGPRSARLARLLNGSEIDPLDERRAREVGVRLGARGAVDVADAQVVCTAVEHGAAVATSNPNDIANLLRTGETLDIVPV